MDSASKQYLCSNELAIKQKAQDLGFDACGFALATNVSDDAVARYNRWIAQGMHDCMQYAEKYADIRRSPDLLFPGAKTIISVAMNYFPERKQPADAPQFAYYAYGNDYHDVLRNRLQQLADYILQLTGETSRVCVDTAPIREKYWAQMAGVGFIGRNNLLIIPQKGSYFFLGEIVTTLSLQPDEPLTQSCGNCNRCVEACPGGAIKAGEPLNAARCLSCQLIERRGELPKWVAQAQNGKVYGCDECQKCCPHNQFAKPSKIIDFAPSNEFLSLTAQKIASMQPADFKRIFGKSAVRRAKLEGLLRNLANNKND